ncbi:MAG: peptidyl-prolyl cis-trans isomerase [Actinomycetota bacterium]|nr:peptidyl-prolyl cis-trans isomerase [Actinomycetota bacterium]
MSPHARERARQQRRNKKRQSVLAQRALESRRNKQVLVIVLILLVVVGGLVGVSLAVHKDDKPAAAAQPVAGCVAPPKVPTDHRTRTLPAKGTAAGKTFVATVSTNCGIISMELDGSKAPQTVASFVGLAKSGYWVDSPCHRLTTTGIFVLQCGDPTGTGGGNPGYGFGVENPPASFKYPAGTLAMARTTDPKTNGGQFFIVYKETELKDAAGYSIFGKITSGMDIVDRIAAAGLATDANQNAAPRQHISILAVNVTEKKASQ